VKLLNIIVRIGIVAVVVQASVIGFASRQKEGGGRLALPPELYTVVVTNAQPCDVVRSILKAGIRVCYEETVEVSQLQLSLDISDSPATNIVKRLASLLPAYTWENPKGTDIFIVRPKKSALNWTIPRLSVSGRTFCDVVLDEDMLGFSEHGIHPFHWGFAQPISFQVNVQKENASALECLNALIAISQNLCWTIRTNSNGKKLLTFSYKYVKPTDVDSQ